MVGDSLTADLTLVSGEFAINGDIYIYIYIYIYTCDCKTHKFEYKNDVYRLAINYCFSLNVSVLIEECYQII